MAHHDARVLILGSLPGVMSLQRGEYYAQPRNAFWRIIGELAGASPELPYTERLQRLNECGIALWDVCAAGRRAGSLDSAIDLASVEPNDFGKFLHIHSGIRRICFNGQRAKEIFDRKVVQSPRRRFESLRYQVLPSTSPAHAGMPFAQKLAHWREALYDVNPLPIQTAAPDGDHA